MDYIPTAIQTMQTMRSLYGPGNGLANPSPQAPANAASGGLPGNTSGPAYVWVALVALLIVFRIMWEKSPASKG